MRRFKLFPPEDDFLAETRRKDNARMGAIMHNMEPWKRQLIANKGYAKRRVAAKTARKLREEVEADAEQLVRDIVSALSLMMARLRDTPHVDKFQRRVKDGQLHNVLAYLISKCGVNFDDHEFAKKKPLIETSDGLSVEFDHYQRLRGERQRREEIAQREAAELAKEFMTWRKVKKGEL